MIHMITDFATTELQRLNELEPSAQAKFNWDILTFINTLKEQGRIDDGSAPYVLNAVVRLAALKPLTPLTGEDSEWALVPPQQPTDETVFINKRCPSVMKKVNNDTNQVYVLDNEAVVISSDGGLTWWDKDKSVAQVNFPYFPPVNPTVMYVEPTDDPEQFTVITDEEKIKNLRELSQAKIQEKSESSETVEVVAETDKCKDSGASMECKDVQKSESSAASSNKKYIKKTNKKQ